MGQAGPIFSFKLGEQAGHWRARRLLEVKQAKARPEQPLLSGHTSVLAWQTAADLMSPPMTLQEGLQPPLCRALSEEVFC